MTGGAMAQVAIRIAHASAIAPTRAVRMSACKIGVRVHVRARGPFSHVH
jgi:hypothetical protein